MISLRISGVRTDICFSFLLFNAVIFMMRENQTILSFYGGCILHELGHILAAAAVGMKLHGIAFTGMGILMTAEKKPVFPLWKSLFVMLSGPCVNLICAVIFHLTGGSSLFHDVNIGLCVYNLMPFSWLDGGSVMELLVCGTSCEYALRRCITVLRAVIIAAAVIAVILITINPVNFCLPELKGLV